MMLIGSISVGLLPDVLVKSQQPFVRHVFNAHNQLLQNIEIFLRLQPHPYKPADSVEHAITPVWSSTTKRAAFGAKPEVATITPALVATAPATISQCGSCIAERKFI
jgi:hypothetical protein